MRSQGRGARPHQAPGAGWLPVSTRDTRNSPAALPAGDEQREHVEGQEDAQAEEHAPHVGFRCAEPGQALSGDLLLWDPMDPSTRSPEWPLHAYRLWQVTPSPPASSAGRAGPRGHLEEGTGWGLSTQLVAAGMHSQWVPPPAYLVRHRLRRGSRAVPPRTPHPPSSPPPPRRNCCWGNPSSATAIPDGGERSLALGGSGLVPPAPGRGWHSPTLTCTVMAAFLVMVWYMPMKATLLSRS